MSAGAWHEGSLRSRLQQAGQTDGARSRMQCGLNIRWSSGPDVEPRCGELSLICSAGVNLKGAKPLRNLAVTNKQHLFVRMVKSPSGQ